jgi:3-oxoadipate enol-lactonase
MIAATPAEGYAGCCEAISTFDARGDLDRISAPTLVIGGAQDPAIPPDHQRAIAAGVTGAELMIIEDAAHLPNIQHVDIVNRLIAEHLGVEL